MKPRDASWGEDGAKRQRRQDFSKKKDALRYGRIITRARVGSGRVCTVGSEDGAAESKDHDSEAGRLLKEALIPCLSQASTLTPRCVASSFLAYMSRPNKRASREQRRLLAVQLFN